MTRQNIFEILKEKYDIVDEMNKINDLFNLPLFHRFNGYSTIEGMFYSMFFKTWKHRGTCLSCEEIRKKLEIPNKFTKLTLEKDYIITLEYYLNILYPITENIYDIKCNDWKIDDRFIMLIENINILLEHLNYEKKLFEEKEMILVLPKNPEATAVAEMSTPETAFAILKYNHSSLKGNLKDKKQLLLSIYNEYEPLFKSSIENYNDFLEKVNALFNTLDIRHNNRTRENNKNTVININEKELESWYDELYQLMLFCVLINDNIDRKRKVKEFLKSLKGINA